MRTSATVLGATDDDDAEDDLTYAFGLVDNPDAALFDIESTTDRRPVENQGSIGL